MLKVFRLTSMKLLWLAASALLMGCGSGINPAAVRAVTNGKTGVPPVADRNGVPLHTVLPSHFDPTRAYRWVIYDHAYEQAGSAILRGDPLTQSLADALGKAGYLVASSDYRMEDCWGNAGCVEDIRNLYDAYRSNLNLEEQPFFLGASMGGVVTLNTILHGAVTPKAMVGIYPVCNLQAMYAEDHFVPSIQAAYGFSGAGNLSAATISFDPVHSESLMPLTAFPILIWASYGDTVVDRSQNTDVLTQLVNALGGNVTVRSTTGDHGDPSNFQPDAVVSFFNSVP